MSKGYYYSIVEGLKGLKRAKFSSIISVFTIFLTLTIIAVFLIFIFNVTGIVKQIQSRMEVEVYIDNSFTRHQVTKIQKSISNIAGVDSVLYVSKEDAARSFKQQLGQDLFEILDDNPLPASFRLKLNQQSLSAKNAHKIFDEIIKIDGVDEILYRHDLLVLLEKYKSIFVMIIIIAGSLMALGSIVLVSNTIKLIIFSRHRIIEIMKFVGATRAFIRRPFIVEGIIQGATGGVFAALFFYVLLKLIKLEIPGLILIDKRIYFYLLLLGILLGFVGSILAMRKFLK